MLASAQTGSGRRRACVRQPTENAQAAQPLFEPVGVCLKCLSCQTAPGQGLVRLPARRRQGRNDRTRGPRNSSNSDAALYIGKDESLKQCIGRGIAKFVCATFRHQAHVPAIAAVDICHMPAVAIGSYPPKFTRREPPGRCNLRNPGVPGASGRGSRESLGPKPHCRLAATCCHSAVSLTL